MREMSQTLLAFVAHGQELPSACAEGARVSGGGVSGDG